MPDRVEPARVVPIPLIQEIGDVDMLAATSTYSLVDTYLDIVATKGPQFVEILEIMADEAEEAVLVHCLAGKDRTGLVTAMLLGVLGVADAEIIRDYSRSGKELGNGFVEDVQKMAGEFQLMPDHVRLLLDSEPSNMETVFETIRRDFGSITAYLQYYGLSSATIEALRAKFIEA